MVTLRILLVESEQEEILFLRDLLGESEETPHGDQWIHFEAVHATSWAEASAILASELVDVILLNPDLPDSQGAETFRRARAVAPQIPAILLIGEQDTSLAVRLIREGAQDFLIKKELDCTPLVHAIQTALERHRLLWAARSAAMTDPLTSLPSRAAFLLLADRDRRLAARLGRRLMVMIAEPKNLAEIANAYGEQRRDLALVEAADHMCALAAPTDFIARIEETRFGLSIFDTDSESVELAWTRIHGAAAERRIQVGAAIFDPDRPASLETLLEQAALDLTPAALAMRR